MTDALSSRQTTFHRSFDFTDIMRRNAQPRSESVQCPAVRVVKIAAGKNIRVSWDDFAHQCEASFRCAYDAIATYQHTGKLTFSPILFDILLTEDGKKVGQCGVTKNRTNQYVIEVLQMLPAYQALWEPAMAAVLRELGPGRYRYGSHWSIDPPREAALRRVPGVVIEDMTPVIIEAIDFSRWETWDCYLKDVSSNVRRNAARAIKGKPHLRIRIRSGLATLLDFIEVIRLHRTMLERKNMDVSVASFGTRLLLRTLSLRRHIISAVAVEEGRLLATYSGIGFGPNIYYLNGSSATDNGGAAWFLLLHMIKDAHARTNGTGKFFMGSVRADDPGWAGLHRSRLHCRVSDYTTSLVSFSYRPQ